MIANNSYFVQSFITFVSFFDKQDLESNFFNKKNIISKYDYVSISCHQWNRYNLLSQTSSSIFINSFTSLVEDEL